MGHGRPSRRARTELRAQGRSYGAGLINPPHRHNRCLMQPRKPWHAMRWGDGWRRSRSRLSASSRLVNQPDGASLLTTRTWRRRRFVFYFFLYRPLCCLVRYCTVGTLRTSDMDPLQVPTGSRLGFWPSCLPAQPRRRWKGPWTQRSASHLPLHVCVAPARSFALPFARRARRLPDAV